MNLAELLSPGCALFLDFDGTLVDIAPRPEAVLVPPGLIDTLAALNELFGGAVALVSGRPIDQIDRFFAPLRLATAGVHGAERRRADGTVALLEVHAPAVLEQAARELARQHPGLQVETKRGSVALHYRLAPELEAICVEAMQAAVDAWPDMVLLRGKMVVEAKPGSASKGRAIEDFLHESPFERRRPVFVGDDVTDEAGFGAVQRLGGLGVKVGEGASVASHRVASPAAVREQLQQVIARVQKARR